MAMVPLSLAPKTIKFLMFAFNLLFVVTAIALLSIGVVLHGIYYQYHHFLDDSFFSVPSLLIAVGCIIFIIALLGCCGAGRENYCMIVTFCMLLAGIFILEIIGGTMGYVMRASVKSVAEQKMLDTMVKYNSSKEISLVWDEMQRNFDCCGTINASDWMSVHYSGIPMSCCADIVGVIGNTSCTLTSTNLHKMGCIDAFARFAQKHAGKIAGVGMGLGMIQVIGIFLSAYLARSIKNRYQTM